MSTLSKDMQRYEKERIPAFHKYFRKAQSCRFKPLKMLYIIIFVLTRNQRLIDLSVSAQIGEGLYFGHPSSITINPKAIIGRNVNIHKGVTIGQENRGKRKGTPTIGDYVWIGIGAVVVGNIKIGNDVLIAPNSYVNCDVPDHSIVIGNPCIIKHRDNATEGYINNAISLNS